MFNMKCAFCNKKLSKFLSLNVCYNCPYSFTQDEYGVGFYLNNKYYIQISNNETNNVFISVVGDKTYRNVPLKINYNNINDMIKQVEVYLLLQ